MQSGEITWQIVSNTVAKRMIDHSLIHKLIPSRRLRRRNKIMNIALKQFHGLKTYSQYIKMKTSIIRNLSDDSETDDNVSFTDDDYNILYKSDLSLTNYITQMSNITKNYSCFETEFESSKNDIHNKKNTEIPTKKSKSKSLKTINLGWQKIVKEKTKNSSSFAKKTKMKDFTDSNFTCQTNDIQSNTHANLKTIDKFFVSCSKDNTLNSTNEVISNKIRSPEVKNSDNSELEQSHSMSDNSEKFQSNENHSIKMLSSPGTETLKKVKKNLTSLLDDINEIQNNNDSFDQNHFNRLEKNQNSKETFVDKVKSKKFPIIQTSIIGSMYQPKDSGIEEATEEEFLEHGKNSYKKLKTQIGEQNALTTSNTENCKSNLTSCDNNLKSKSCNITIKSDFKDKALSINENVQMSQKEYKKEVQKHKLQKPKITHTEICKKKYKIVCSTSLFNKSAELEILNRKDCSDEKHDKKQTEQYMEDNIFPLTEKRLQQLRRLNLTVDSDSSLSENDDTNCTIENMRDKLFKRSKEFSDTLDSEDENVYCKHDVSNQSDKKLQKNENPLKRITYCLNNENNILKQCSKVKKDSFADIEQSSFASNESVSDKLICLESSLSHNCNYKEDAKGSKGKNQKIETMIEIVNKNNRPHNLQELIKKENLTLETITPSFKFKDIHEEDELFIIDIPSVVLENQLLGNKIILTENQLKFGKQKYKVECKDIDKISCVFANRKPGKPYKIVNVKPIARVVTREKINSTYNADNTEKVKQYR